MMKTLKLAAAAVVMMSGMASAQDFGTGMGGWSGFYGGVQAEKLMGGSKKSGASDTRATGKAFGLHGGYLQDMDGFVLGGELAYDKLKDVKYRGASMDGSMIRAKAIAGYDMGQFLPYATLGAERLTLENAAAQGGDIKANGLVYGLGVKMKATEQILVGAELLKHDYKDINKSEPGKQKLDSTTLGVNVSYRF